MFISKRFFTTVALIASLFVYAVSHFTPNKTAKIQSVAENLVLVKRVIDGDTIVLYNDERVRYIGINTPEIARRGKKAEYYGKEATDFNKGLVLGKQVKLEFDREHFDRYGRTLAYVYLEDGVFVNAELVKQGYARTMSIKPNTRYAELFRQLQEEAKTKRLGVWKK